MSRLHYESVLGAFQKIGAIKADGTPYQGVRGVSVSATGQHFRFWSTDATEGAGTVEISRPASSPRPAWLSEPQGSKFFLALEEARRNQQPVYGTVNVKSDIPDPNGNSVATRAAALMTPWGKPSQGTVIEADSRTGRLLIRFTDVQLGPVEDRTDTSPSEPQWLTTRELAEALAGGDAYIRTKNGEVKGLAITPSKNPDAPSIVIVGNGPRIQASAELFMRSGYAVPVYLKERTKQWRLAGRFRAVAYKTDSDTIAAHSAGRPLEEIAGILFLERAQQELEITPGAGRGLVDPAMRVLIELAAVKAVCCYYSKLNFEVKSVESENRGFDLIANRGNEIVHLEVKGTSASVPRFFISRNERRCAEVDPRWRLIVVTDALSPEPILHEMNAAQAESLYEFDALSWECTPRAPVPEG